MKDLARGVFKLQATDKNFRAEKVKRSLSGLGGISSIDINYITRTVYVEYDPNKATVGEIKKAIEASEQRR